MKINNKGFSLIEVLVTVGLIGVLVGIAIPSYNKYKDSTNRVALQADLGNGSKTYTAFDAVNGSFCANWEQVGLSDSGKNVFEKSLLYRREGFIGFEAFETDCAGITKAEVQHVSKDLTASTADSTDCAKYGGAWTAGSPGTCSGGTFPSGFAYGGSPGTCKLGDSKFKMGASSYQIGGSFYQVDDKGIVSQSSANDCQ